MTYFSSIWSSGVVRSGVFKGGARTVLRALPVSRDFLERPDGPLTRLQQDQANKAKVLESDAYGDPQESEDVLDILVPSYIWGAANLEDELNEDKMKLTPSERISLSSVLAVLPHFNKSCACEHLKCSCCIGVEIVRRNLTACASLSYIRERFAVVGQLTVKNRTIIEKELISGSNPPPLCFPIPQLPIIRVCLRFSNISFTSDAQFQACLALEMGFVFTQPLIRLRFGCMKVGHGGVSWSSTPSANSLSFQSDEDAQTAFHQFAAALNSTDTEQFQLLQSILRQQELYEKPSSVLSTRSRKMAWPLA